MFPQYTHGYTEGREGQQGCHMINKKYDGHYSIKKQNFIQCAFLTGECLEMSNNNNHQNLKGRKHFCDEILEGILLYREMCSSG